MSPGSPIAGRITIGHNPRPRGEDTPGPETGPPEQVLLNGSQGTGPRGPPAPALPPTSSAHPMKTLATAAALLGALAWTAPKMTDGNPQPELGRVRWGRDLDAALTRTGVDGKPTLLLFQEVPG